jgi:antitoxin HigA-1
MKKFIQHSPPHPGQILIEFYFEPLNLMISEAAQKLFITRPNLSSIINGRAGISPLMATKLAKAFKTSPKYWMNIQASYELWQVSQSERRTIDEVKELV